MNHDTLRQVIFDQHRVIEDELIVPREYRLEPQANYALVGLRRAGKSTLLHGMVQDLVASGVGWERIIYINFEDERLADFTIADFNDIVLVQSELSELPGHFFFDEIQVVDGWERFVRRLADAHEHVCITGSNARMLSSEIATTLGGRFLIRQVHPYSFGEYLDAIGQAHGERDLVGSKTRGRLLAAFDDYLLYGGFPEELLYRDRRTYVESVYQKVLLGDIAVRHDVRNAQALRVLMKKVAQTVCSEVSYSKLHGTLSANGMRLSKDTLIDYISYAREAYLLYGVQNAVAPFVDREGSPKYYFGDVGLLALFASDSLSALLENVVALRLLRRYGEEVWHVQSTRTGIDVDFYVPEVGLAVQVAYETAGSARGRELDSLARLARTDAGCERLVIVTRAEEGVVEAGGARIEVVPAYRFLLEN